MDESLYPAIEDICQRVFGLLLSVRLTSDALNKQLLIQLMPKQRQDALTQSQQEMDAILSIQHLLTEIGWSVKLEVI